MASIKIKKGDTARKISDTLVYTGLDLTGATVVLVWRKPDFTIVRRTATIVDPVACTVEYQVVTADVDSPGSHLLEWEITFPSGGVLTIPTDGYINLEIANDLG